jgi:hypothetical protein
MAQDISKRLQIGFTLNGVINGSTFLACGPGTIGLEGTAPLDLQLRILAMPRNFHPYVLIGAGSALLGARTDGTGVNLWDLSGGSFGFRRTARWSSLPNDRIEWAATATTVGDRLVLQVNFLGTYSGPTEGISVRNFALRWIPAGKEVSEQITATINASGAASFQMTANTTYFGLQRELPAPQEFQFTKFARTFVNNLLTMQFQARVKRVG